MGGKGAGDSRKGRAVSKTGINFQIFFSAPFTGNFIMNSWVHIKSDNIKNAIIQGAEKLGVATSDVKVSEEKEDGYIISLIDSPGKFEIEIPDDKMSAVLKVTPPSGKGPPVSLEQIEKTLSDMGVIHGIDKDIILTTVKKVRETGEAVIDTVIASGTPPGPGEKAKIELKTGRDAANRDPKASCMVKPGQVLAIKIPPAPGKHGKNIFAEDISSIPGPDIHFSPGENVITKDKGITFISEVYGSARGTLQEVTVTDFVKVSRDRMQVEMNLFPVLADNSLLLFDDITEILKNRGIKHGINVTSIKAALEKGEPVEKLKIAEATPAKNGIDAKIDFKFKVNGKDPEEIAGKRHAGIIETTSITNDLVMEGDILAVKIPAVKQEDGKTVSGEILKGIKPNDRRIRAGNNVVTSENGLEFLVVKGVIAGYADFADDTISVYSPLSVAEDKLSASITVHPPSSKGNVLTLDMVNKIIDGAGITYGVDLDEINSLLSSVKKNNFQSKTVIVAKGDAPVNGKDAVIDLKFDRDRKAGSIVEKTDRMDFREQSFIVNIRKGDILAEKFPLTPGIDGKNIFGEKVTATPGKDRKMIHGANVVLSEDGLTMVADKDGMIAVADGNKISVLKRYEVPGDIDMNTGNLTMDGSLFIKGWVRAGFVVRASGDINIGNGIEQATVEAGTGLVINGGVLGSKSSKIFSGANLTAFFLENANVHARGDIIIRDDIRHSNVTAGGRIDITGGKGQIMGGTVNAFKGINANKIGSSAGVKTSVITGLDPELTERINILSEHLENFKRQRAKIEMYLFRFSGKGKTSQIPRNIRFKLDKLIKQRRDIVQKEKRFNAYRENLIKKEIRLSVDPPSIIVNNAVYAGTKIMINKSFLDIEEDIEGKVKFSLDSNNHKINIIK